MTIANALRRIRSRSGRSLGWVAARAGIAESNFSTIEHGRREPRAATIDRLAAALDITFLPVATGGRSTTAETADHIAAALAARDTATAYRAIVQVADQPRASSFLQQAEERISQLPLLTIPAVRYGIAYNACHDVGEALLAAYGYRTNNGPGQHEAVGRARRAILDSPPADAAATQFDRLRRARNQNRYEARPVGPADSTKAHDVALDLHGAALKLFLIA